MARYIKVGDLVELKRDTEGFFKGDWGKVVYIDEDNLEYHVAMFNDETNCPIFIRSEIKLMPNNIVESVEAQNDWSGYEIENITLEELFSEMDMFADGTST